MALSNKLSNIIGTRIPQWIINQLTQRSVKGSLDSRNNDNLLYLTNKTSWVRLVSSVRLNEDKLKYFKDLYSNEFTFEDGDSLAKNFVLYAGTSAYSGQGTVGQQRKYAKYNIRSGALGKNPTYGVLGNSEVKEYGYRPMPGINSVNISTTGRLGSLKQATVNFKCWDRDQLEVINTLYFKLGYTMFLEWGHTYYYPSQNLSPTDLNLNPDKVSTTEIFSIDVFEKDLNKEKIFRQIAKNSRDSEGNYDAMLGIVTNFNFSFNQEGGYDCTLKIISLGVLADYMKINNPTEVPNLLKDQLLEFNATIESINSAGGPTLEELEAYFRQKQEEEEQQYVKKKTIPEYIQEKEKIRTQRVFPIEDVIETYSIAGSQNADSNLYYLYDDKKDSTSGYYLFAPNGYRIYKENPTFFVDKIRLNYDVLYSAISKIDSQVKNIQRSKFGDQSIKELTLNAGVERTFPKIVSFLNTQQRRVQDGYAADSGRYDLIDKNSGVETIYMPYEGLNGRLYFLKLKFELPDNIFNSVKFNPKTREISSDSLSESQKQLIAQNQPLSEVQSSIIIEGQEFDVNQFLEIPYKLVELALYNLIMQSSTDTPTAYDLTFSSNNIKFDVEEFTESPTGILPFQGESGIENSGFRQFLDFITFDASPSFSKQIYKSLLLFGPKYTKVSEKESVLTSLVTVGNQNALNLAGLPQTDQYMPILTFSGEYRLNLQNTVVKYSAATDKYFASDPKPVSYPIKFEITTSDPDFIEEIIPSSAESGEFYESYNAKKAQLEKERREQNQILEARKEEQQLRTQELSSQIYSALSLQSSLELMLRTIQVKALNAAIKSPEFKNEEGPKVFAYKIYEDERFLTSVFSNGIYSKIITNLVNNPRSILQFSENFDYTTQEEKAFAINALYGFATSLMGSDDYTDPQFLQRYRGKEVNYKELLKVYVVPYAISQDLVAGIQTHNPVYISLGTLLMLINHSCTVYDSKIGEEERAIKGFQKPMVYIDYNPNLNFFLTCPEHLSTNPWITLIPFEGKDKDYKKLFDGLLENDNYIKGSKLAEIQQERLFSFDTQDALSYQLYKNGIKIKHGNPYTGKIMNVLLNLDYVVDLVRNYSYQNSTNNVYLRPFIENILSDVNKYLGNYNALRLSYSDAGNTLQIVDDQFVPNFEESILPKKFSLDQNQPQNRTTIPLFGLKSIAKSMDLKTDISTKLSNLIVFSANPNSKDQAQISTSGDAVGFLSNDYVDRIVSGRAGIQKQSNEGELISAGVFNKTISQFFGGINISKSDVSQVTSFYIDKLVKRKVDTQGTRSSFLIPLGLTFSTDGIGGLVMGQGFTIEENLLPKDYYLKGVGTIDNVVGNMGFVVVGLDHTIQSNTWTTSVRTHMLPLKDATDFSDVLSGPSDKALSFRYNSKSYNPTPNADRLRTNLNLIGNGNFVSIKRKEDGYQLANNGDINESLVNVITFVFDTIYQNFVNPNENTNRTKYPNLGLEITAGNDLWHRENSPNSPHTAGRAIDFVFYPNKLNKNKKGEKDDAVRLEISQLIKAIVPSIKTLQGVSMYFLDEYDEPSEKAEGLHFHINILA